MKMVRLQRLLHILNLLQSGQAHCPGSLAERLGVSRRTVFRDIRTLEEAGIPCHFDEEQNSYCFDESFFLPPLELELPEAMALMTVIRHMASRFPGSFQGHISRAGLKIENALPPALKLHCGRAMQRTSAQLGPLATQQHNDNAFDILQEAVTRRRMVEITYRSPVDKEAFTTTLSPYHLHFSRRAWYIIGHSSCHDEVRIFKVGRIRSLTPLERLYLLDEPFDVEAFLGDAWGIIPEGRLYEVALRFSPMVAENVAEVFWHPKQQLSPQPDGSLIYRVQVDGLREITWWILGYGDQVTVLEPPELRRAIIERINNMTNNYQSREELSPHESCRTAR